MLENWMKSYRPEELFDEHGKLARRASPRSRPTGDRRMGANPHANGGLLLKDLRMPDFRDYAVDVAQARRRYRPKPRACWASSCAMSMKLNQNSRNFRVFGPDETASNRLDALSSK